MIVVGRWKDVGLMKISKNHAFVYVISIACVAGCGKIDEKLEIESALTAPITTAPETAAQDPGFEFESPEEFVLDSFADASTPEVIFTARSTEGLRKLSFVPDEGDEIVIPLVKGTKDFPHRFFFPDKALKLLLRAESISGVITEKIITKKFQEKKRALRALISQLDFIKTPRGMAVDAQGNLHVVDASLNRILKITPDGDFSRIAGTDFGGFSGDDGPAIEASLTFPDDLVIDRNGNIFFSDSGNAVIRKIDTNGIITTFANEVIVPFGLALDPEGNIFVADGGGHQIIKILPTGGKVVIAGTGIPGSSGDGGPATEAKLSGPIDVAFDTKGNLFISERNNHKIRKIAPDGTISAVAGKGTAGFSGDGGPATEAELNTPFGILVDNEDNLLIADSRNNRIRKIDMATENISTFAGVGTPSLEGLRSPIGDGGPASESAIGRPTYLASDAAGNLFISQDESPLSINSRLIRQIDVNGIISTFFGKGGDGFLGTTGRRPASEVRLNNPQALARDASGNLYYIDFNNHMIHKLDITRNEVFIIAGDIFLNPGFSGDGGPATKAQLNGPRNIALFPVDIELDINHLFISDTGNHRIRRVDQFSTITTVVGNGVRGFGGDGGPATQAQLNFPRSIVLDKKGNLFIADRQNHRVRKVDTEGIITTIAGTGVNGFSGDGGPATNAALNSPFDVLLDEDGNLYIADADNFRIRKIDPNGIITTLVQAEGQIFNLSPGNRGAIIYMESTPSGRVIRRFLLRNGSIQTLTNTDGKIFRPLDMLVHGSSIFVTQPHVVVESHLVD